MFSNADIDVLAELAGDLTAIAISTAFTVIFVGLAAYLFVRAARTWRRTPGALPYTTKRVILSTLLIAPIFHWSKWRHRLRDPKDMTVADVATVSAALAIPVLLLAWGLGAVMRRRTQMVAASYSSTRRSGQSIRSGITSRRTRS